MGRPCARGLFSCDAEHAQSMPLRLPRPLVPSSSSSSSPEGVTGHHQRDAISTAIQDRRHSWVTAKRSRFSRVACFGDSLSDAGCALFLFNQRPRRFADLNLSSG